VLRPRDVAVGLLITAVLTFPPAGVTAGSISPAALMASPAASLSPTASPSPSPSPVSSPAAAPPVLTPELAAALTTQLGQLRARQGIPGIQVAIVFPDGRSWRAHAGFRNYGARLPVRNSTPFPIASVSKTFLATLVVQLAQEGRFGLDEPLLTYLPSAKVDPTVTIRELLDHTSGIYDFFLNPTIDDALLGCRTCRWTPAKALSYVKKPWFAPGAAWAYSNTNYVLLGQLVETITGRSYAELLRQRFFDPLGLISTYVQVEERAPFPVVHSYEFSTTSVHERPTPLWDGTGVSPFRSLVTAAGSAGAIASSARDLAVWARALYGGRVLGAEGSRTMLDFANAASVHSSIPYGLGVEEFSVAGHLAYGHGGRLLGARSTIRYLPVEGLSIAVVTNTDRADPAAIVEALVGIVLPPQVPAAPVPMPLPVPSPSPFPLPQLVP
jgi:D-alanyl-D-alanine carboxypeptidase